MELKEIMYCVAENHNRLAQLVANGIDLKTGDNVILMGDVIKDLRMLVHKLQEITKTTELQGDTETK